MDVWKKHVQRNWNVFDTYSVRLRLDNVVGGKPASAKMIEKWVDATNDKKSEEERNKIKEAHMDTLPDLTEDKATKQSCVFSRYKGQLCLEGRQVKALLKECGNIIKTVVPGSKKGELDKVARLKSKIAEQVFVMEDYIPLGRTEPDETTERPIHVMTAQGPRTSIKRTEVVKDVEIEFTMKRRKGRGKDAVPEKVLMAVLDYGQLNGLGADRSIGMGTFKVLSVEKLEE